jgi:hypothetical protein
MTETQQVRGLRLAAKQFSKHQPPFLPSTTPWCIVQHFHTCTLPSISAGCCTQAGHGLLHTTERKRPLSAAPQQPARQQAQTAAEKPMQGQKQDGSRVHAFQQHMHTVSPTTRVPACAPCVPSAGPANAPHPAAAAPAAAAPDAAATLSGQPRSKVQLRPQQQQPKQLCAAQHCR